MAKLLNIMRKSPGDTKVPSRKNYSATDGIFLYGKKGNQGERHFHSDE